MQLRDWTPTKDNVIPVPNGTLYDLQFANGDVWEGVRSINQFSEFGVPTVLHPAHGTIAAWRLHAGAEHTQGNAKTFGG